MWNRNKMNKKKHKHREQINVFLDGWTKWVKGTHQEVQTFNYKINKLGEYNA